LSTGTLDLTCTGHHAHRGKVVRCQQATGHPMPHAAEVGEGRQPEIVTWEHDMGRRAAEAEAARWRHKHQR
jgi:hypothetical protein